MRLRLLVACVVAALLTGAATTTVSASTYAYDGPTITRVDVGEFEPAGATPAQFGGSRDGSASSSGAAQEASTTPGARSVATNSVDDFVDLTTPGARTHILDGEIRPNVSYSGGHRPGTGFPGKSEFPSGWSDGRILHEISDVATEPAATRIVQGSRTIVTGSRGGVDTRVVIDEATGEIVTGYPTNMPINP